MCRCEAGKLSRSRAEGGGRIILYCADMDGRLQYNKTKESFAIYAYNQTTSHAQLITKQENREQRTQMDIRPQHRSMTTKRKITIVNIQIPPNDGHDHSNSIHNQSPDTP